jgi:hypothetical protein
MGVVAQSEISVRIIGVRRVTWRFEVSQDSSGSRMESWIAAKAFGFVFWSWLMLERSNFV